MNKQQTQNVKVIVAEDPGLWYINGRIRTGAFRERVWAAFKKLTDAYYVRRFAMEARHRAEAATMDREFDEIQKRKPFTPWVGRADEGAVPAFVASAERDDMRRKQNLKKSWATVQEREHERN
jgi:crotonobetainyl-CoA:carnitine CoA-transferase CaiB-like acyl-CoA transferase